MRDLLIKPADLGLVQVRRMGALAKHFNFDVSREFEASESNGFCYELALLHPVTKQFILICGFEYRCVNGANSAKEIIANPEAPIKILGKYQYPNPEFNLEFSEDQKRNGIRLSNVKNMNRQLVQFQFGKCMDAFKQEGLKKQKQLAKDRAEYMSFF